MRPPVPRQVSRGPEPFPADVALVGPLVGVNPLVGRQVAALRKRLPAEPASVRLLARVRPFVNDDARRVVGGVGAEATPALALFRLGSRRPAELASGVPGGKGTAWVMAVEHIASWMTGRPCWFCCWQKHANVAY